MTPGNNIVREAIELALAAAALAWPFALIAVAAICVPTIRRYFELLARRHEQRRVEYDAIWSYSEAPDTTETVATIVAAAVAARVFKLSGKASSPKLALDARAVLDYEDLRRIVRRMMQSINGGEARRLRNKVILWVHKFTEEDYFENNALRNLGAQVIFFSDNETLVTYLRQEYREDRFSVLALITNRGHWLSKDDRTNGKPADENAALKLLHEVAAQKQKNAVRRSLPVIVYSRSVVSKSDDEFQLRNAGAEECTDLPERVFHLLFQAAAELTREVDQRVADAELTKKLNAVSKDAN